ncbi:MAG: methyltransferase [Chitinophagales bacterium]|nr:methyltransferase [Chitinophagales bacterium]MDW8428290.1 methyltransferase [Chitinophagales bacterium]
MARTYFQFKNFRIEQRSCAMKVTTDACVFGAWLQVPQQGAVLDLGTGTGLLALMVAQRTALPVDAIELDAGCARTAAANFASSPWADRLRLLCGDIRFYTADRTYTLVVCNPPFFSNQLLPAHMGRRQARHDVSLTLNDVFVAAQRMLEPLQGKLAVLWPASQLSALMRLSVSFRMYLEQQLFIQASPTRPPHCVACLLAQAPVQVHQQHLLICDHQGQYTAEFRRLLQPYYLHF